MHMHETDEAAQDTREYLVVINNEEQYSIWLAGKPVPPGWREGGRRGSKQDCLSYIESVWTDMRPLSMRGGTEESRR